MNHVMFRGNLVDDVRTMTNAQGGLSAFGKIGVYNGKTKEGEQRQSMFFDIVAFGRNAEMLRDMTTKGTPIVVSGRLEEDTTVSQTNGQTYINKRVVCDNVCVCVKPIQQTQAQQVPVQTVQAQPQYTQPIQQPQYAQPVQPMQQQYAQPVQNNVSPW